MRTLSAIFTFLFFTSVFSQKIENIKIFSKELNQSREFMVYTPMSYEVSEFSYFNVIYVFDAHDRSLFDFTTSVTNLIKEGHEGFIFVGIKSTWIKDKFYGRNHDLLPSGTKFPLGPNSNGNAENFLKYVKNEVIPYIESNYRVLPHRTAVGHSLSASFVLYSLLENSNTFHNYIAISPNLAYDDHYLVKRLKNFNSSQFTTKKYLYLSHANEGVDTAFWKGWKEANEEAYPILKNQLPSKNFDVVTEVFPDKMHREGFIPGFQSAAKYLLNNIEPQQERELSKKTYQVTFKVKVPFEDDELYITGNQKAFSHWDPSKLKLEKVSPFFREITLEVQDPIKAKFTRGSWKSEAWLKVDGGQTNFPFTSRPKNKDVYEVEIVYYNDKR